MSEWKSNNSAVSKHFPFPKKPEIDVKSHSYVPLVPDDYPAKVYNWTPDPDKNTST